MLLKSNKEIVGILSEIKFQGDQIRLLFTTICEVELPKEEFTYKQLKSFLGEQVGILNVNGEFFIRVIKSR